MSKRINAECTIADVEMKRQKIHEDSIVHSRVDLNVKFSEKDAAKLLGAMWDNVKKKWYAPSNCQNIDILKQKYTVSSGTDQCNVDKRKIEAELQFWDDTDEPTDDGNYEKVYLGVNFDDKTDAKMLGAMWDTTATKWYIPSNSANVKVLTDKYPINLTPIHLIGENRSFGSNELYVDLVPKECWFTNARFCIDACDWDRVFDHVTSRVSYTCECCEVDMKDNWSEMKINARWSFDEVTKIQKLMRLVAVCNKCHKSTYMSKKDKVESSAHLSTVRGFSAIETTKHIQEAFAMWGKRNCIKWTLDTTLLTDNGIKLRPPAKKQFQ